jgi:hypothetical protein
MLNRRRRLLRPLVAGLLLLLPLLPAGQAAGGEAEVAAFARQLRLRDVDGFAEAVAAVRATGRLPRRYVTKDEAEDLGWRPGSDLCDSAPGSSIGGDRFGNRERRLPQARGRRWFEADLDFACGRRGAKRLVWSSDGLVYVTTDHYETFREVPP